MDFTEREHLIKPTIVFLVLFLPLILQQCDSNSNMTMEEGDRYQAIYPGKSKDERGLTCTTSEVWSVALPWDTGGAESYLCLWTSGTWAATGTWNWSDTDSYYTVGTDGSLTVEFVTVLCNPVPGPLSTIYALYCPPAGKALNYDLICSVYWGYKPALPTGWCWMLVSDCKWTGLPHSHGITVPCEWVSIYNHGSSIPPIEGYCGWPLVNPPPPFTVNGV